MATAALSPRASKNIREQAADKLAEISELQAQLSDLETYHVALASLSGLTPS